MQFVVSDYTGQGEGSTICILVTKAYPHTDDYDRTNSKSYTKDGSFHFEMPPLKEGITPETIALRQFAKEFGDWYAQGATVISKEVFLKDWIHHCPSYMKKMIDNQDDKEKAAGNIYYASTLHLNYSQDTMRYYSYNELDEGVITVSEEDIRKQYYPYWYERMCKKFGKEQVDKDYTFEDCLDDWIVVNWAWHVDE